MVSKVFCIGLVCAAATVAAATQIRAHGLLRGGLIVAILFGAVALLAAVQFARERQRERQRLAQMRAGLDEVAAPLQALLADASLQARHADALAQLQTSYRGAVAATEQADVRLNR